MSNKYIIVTVLSLICANLMFAMDGENMQLALTEGDLAREMTIVAQTQAFDVTRYRSPLHDTPVEDLPSLEMLCNGRVPNKIVTIVGDLTGTLDETQNNFSLETRKCLCLYGPPGTGKSTIAYLIARRCRRPIIHCSGGNFRTAYQASGSEAIREIFAYARQYVQYIDSLDIPGKPEGVIIFIDEIDGTSQKVTMPGSTNEDDRTVKTLIDELDRCTDGLKIFVIFTTNYLQNIDKAILDRCDTLEIGLPDAEIRKNILIYYLRKAHIPMSTDAGHGYTTKCVGTWFLELMATGTRGFSNRSLKALVMNAAREAAHNCDPESRKGWLVGFNIYDFKDRFCSSSAYALTMATVPVLTALASTRIFDDQNYYENLLYSKYIEEHKKIASMETATK